MSTNCSFSILPFCFTEPFFFEFWAFDQLLSHRAALKMPEKDEKENLANFFGGIVEKVSKIFICGRDYQEGHIDQINKNFRFQAENFL